MTMHRVLPVLGLPLSDLSVQDALDEVAAMVERGLPDYFVTANLDHALRSQSDERLRDALCAARFVTADGMPLIWLSRLEGRRLSGRVPGSDLLPLICGLAAERGFRVFLLGGKSGTAERAARQLTEQFAGLQIAGTYCPEFAPLESLDHGRMCAAVRRAKPDILFTSLGSPKGTLWTLDKLEQLQVPVCAEIGAALAFAAGESQRAPRWVQHVGCEWLYRLAQEPGRLWSRYYADGRFLLREVGRRPFQRNLRRTEKLPGERWSAMPRPRQRTDRRANKAGRDWVVTSPPNRRPAERRFEQRDQFTEDSALRMLDAVARRMKSTQRVIADLSGWPDRPSTVAGTVVSLYRLARQANARTAVHGLDTSLVPEVCRIGGPQFEAWLKFTTEQN